MKKRDAAKTVVRRVTVDRMDRGDNDVTRKAKLIFLSLAGLVAILLIVSFVYANKARSERNAVRQELEACKEDNAKLSRWLEERTQEVETLKRQVPKKAQPKAKTAPKKKTPATKKPSRTTRSR